jgi:hypothetical protein
MIRTCDLLVRSQTLYPAELWARQTFDLTNTRPQPQGKEVVGTWPRLSESLIFEAGPQLSELAALDAELDRELATVVRQVIVVHAEIQAAADRRRD